MQCTVHLLKVIDTSLAMFLISNTVNAVDMKTNQVSEKSVIFTHLILGYRKPFHGHHKY
jgi:hypothetical protein